MRSRQPDHRSGAAQNLTIAQGQPKRLEPAARTAQPGGPRDLRAVRPEGASWGLGLQAEGVTGPVVSRRGRFDVRRARFQAAAVRPAPRPPSRPEPRRTRSTRLPARPCPRPPARSPVVPTARATRPATPRAGGRAGATAPRGSGTRREGRLDVRGWGQSRRSTRPCALPGRPAIRGRGRPQGAELQSPGLDPQADVEGAQRASRFSRAVAAGVEVIYSTRPIVAHLQTSGTYESSALPSRPCVLWTDPPGTDRSQP